MIIREKFPDSKILLLCMIKNGLDEYQDTKQITLFP